MIKVSKTVKGDDKMNTKDYIENKKSKKLSDIFKGVLAAGLVVGSMVTSTACKPNQPHESSSSTSTTTEIDINQPIQSSSWDKFQDVIDSIEKKYDIEVDVLKIGISKKDDGSVDCYLGLKDMESKYNPKLLKKYSISEDDFYLIMSVISQTLEVDLPKDVGVIDDLSEFKKFLNEQALQIIMNTILEQEETNQSSQDDLVR